MIDSEQERTIGQLVADASRDVSDILRHEVALAKAELRVGVRNGALAGGLFGFAGYLVLLSSIMACIAAGFGLKAAGLPDWGAFLVLAGALVLIAVILVLIGARRVRKVGPPERAIRSTRETIAAVRPHQREVQG